MPSEKILNQKKQFVTELTEVLKGAAAGVLVDYRGITVEDDTKLRSKFREAGVNYQVVKNTLLNFAIKEVGLEDLAGELHGPTAIATHTDDLVSPAKIVSDYAKENENFVVKAGFLEGKVITLDEIKALAATPSKEVLIAKIMGSLNSPASSLVRLLNTIVENGVELADLAAGKAAEAAPAEEAPAVEEAPAEAPAEAAEEEAAPAEEAPAAE